MTNGNLVYLGFRSHLGTSTNMMSRKLKLFFMLFFVVNVQTRYVVKPRLNPLFYYENNKEMIPEIVKIC